MNNFAPAARVGELFFLGGGDTFCGSDPLNVALGLQSSSSQTMHRDPKDAVRSPGVPKQHKTSSKIEIGDSSQTAVDRGRLGAYASFGQSHQVFSVFQASVDFYSPNPTLDPHEKGWSEGIQWIGALVWLLIILLNCESRLQPPPFTGLTTMHKANVENRKLYNVGTTRISEKSLRKGAQTCRFTVNLAKSYNQIM